MAGLYITIPEISEMIGVCESTIKRWIESGVLPQPTIGQKGSKVQAWHKSVLAMAALSKLSVNQNVSGSDEVIGQNMNIGILGSLDRTMAQELANQLYG